jgi:hypothetical protein
MFGLWYPLKVGFIALPVGRRAAIARRCPPVLGCDFAVVRSPPACAVLAAARPIPPGAAGPATDASAGGVLLPINITPFILVGRH